MAKERKRSQDTKEQRWGLEVKRVSFTEAYEAFEEIVEEIPEAIRAPFTSLQPGSRDLQFSNLQSAEPSRSFWWPNAPISVRAPILGANLWIVNGR